MYAKKEGENHTFYFINYTSLYTYLNNLTLLTASHPPCFMNSMILLFSIIEYLKSTINILASIRVSWLNLLQVYAFG